MGSKNPELNAKLKAELTASQPDRSIFSQTAFAAAWTECDDYGEQVAAYVKKNLEFAVEFFRTRIPSIKTYLPDATYLMWLDCSALGFKTQTELSEFFVKEAKVALNPGESFGPPVREARSKRHSSVLKPPQLAAAPCSADSSHAAH